jgi:hypothetical protein
VRIVLGLSLGLVACSTCHRDGQPPPVVEGTDQSYLLCGQAVADNGTEEFSVAGTLFRRQGFHLERQGADDGVSRFGVIAGIEEWNEPNRSNLDALLGQFRRHGVEAIIVAGGIGQDRETCALALTHLAQSGLPVLSLIGASADFNGYRRAVDQVRREHPHLIDLSQIRVVQWDNVALVSLPGYHNPFYLHHRRAGCAYEETDVAALRQLIRAAEQPVLLVAASPPRGRTAGALDYARGGANIGDARLNTVVRPEMAPFGLFGHVYEAGGRATADAAGREAVEPGQWSRSLYLNPGAAEAVPYDLQGGGRSRGMGAVIEIGPQGAQYRPIRLGASPATEEGSGDAP